MSCEIVSSCSAKTKSSSLSESLRCLRAHMEYKCTRCHLRHTSETQLTQICSSGDTVQAHSVPSISNKSNSYSNAEQHSFFCFISDLDAYLSQADELQRTSSAHKVIFHHQNDLHICWLMFEMMAHWALMILNWYIAICIMLIPPKKNSVRQK